MSSDNTHESQWMRTPDPLTLFAFLWACQALVHQEFYSLWLRDNNPLGWILTAFALGTLLWPRSTPLFAAMLFSSVVYNIVKWPFVVNHILMESLINVTILLALVGCYFSRRKRPMDECTRRTECYSRFAPVVATMLVVMYYFAFIAKLNRDFFDPDVSCVAKMYTHDLLRRFPFLPASRDALATSIWATVVIEALIPVLLSFRRTQFLAVLIGMPFHFVLGLIGHRTFSALAFALYGLFLMPQLVGWTTDASERLRSRFGESSIHRVVVVGRIVVLLVVLGLIGANVTGNYQAGIGPLKIERIPWLIWILWSFGIATAYVLAMVSNRRVGSVDTLMTTARPGGLWCLIALVILNGLSQYLGFKTETCFTMYSNLRTEGGMNNHFFMPALRFADYQDDLVEILHTDHPGLTSYIERNQRITCFELKRILSHTRHDCVVGYRRNGTDQGYVQRDGVSSDPSLASAHPLWLAKLLHFRPVSKGDKCECQH